MNPNFALFLQILAYVGLFIGLIGSVAPVIPGPFLIWLSALLWAWADGFNRIGWPTLLALAFLALLAAGSDLLFTAAGARRGGAAWSSLAVAAVAAVVGFLFFNLPGALLGAAGGLLIWEARRQQGDWGQAWAAGKGVLLGYVASAILQVLIAGLMILIFLWQAFLS